MSTSLGGSDSSIPSSLKEAGQSDSSVPLSSSASLKDEVYARVAAKLKGMDASHDISHVERVRVSANSLALEEGVVDSRSLTIINLASLLHDVADRKYSGSESANVEVGMGIMRDLGVEEGIITAVSKVVASVSFSGEMSGKTIPPELLLEASLVQDADRLEAIGAIGIARCFTYGGHKKRALYDAADLDEAAREATLKGEFQSARYAAEETNPTTIAHFYEKLLRLKGMMKTASGKKRAEQRHDFMEHFLDQFFGEVEGKR